MSEDRSSRKRTCGEKKRPCRGGKRISHPAERKEKTVTGYTVVTKTPNYKQNEKRGSSGGKWKSRTWEVRSCIYWAILSSSQSGKQVHCNPRKVRRRTRQKSPLVLSKLEEVQKRQMHNAHNACHTDERDTMEQSKRRQ